MIVSGDLTEFYQRGQKDVIYFVERGFGVTLTTQQKQLMRLYSDMLWEPSKVDHKRAISVHSGHGPGKDASISFIVLHFMTYFPQPKVIVLGPNKPQLFDVFRPELAKWLKRFVLANEFDLQKTRMVYKADRDNSFLSIRTAVVKSSEDTADKLAGIHEEHVLVVGDESSAIPDSIFSTLEGVSTRPRNYRLYVGNPTRNKGYFYDTHYTTGVKEDYIQVGWSSLDSEIVDPKYCERIKRIYGPESNQYRVKVLGLPPLSEQEAFIQIAWVEACRYNTVELSPHDDITAGLDTAREGRDENVLLWGGGHKILGWRRKTSLDTIEIAYWAAGLIIEHNIKKVAVDIIRNPGVYDVLKRIPGLEGIPIEVNVSKSSPADSQFARLRDELCFRVQQNCIFTKYDFPQEQEDIEDFCDELTAVRYDAGSTKFKVEGKRHMLARGEKSPNIFDALMLREYFATDFGTYHEQLMLEHKVNVRQRMFEVVSPKDRWMVV